MKTFSKHLALTAMGGLIFALPLFSQQAPVVSWQHCYGGSSIEYPRAVIHITNDETIVLANTRSSDGDVVGQHGAYDVWLFKTGPTGSIIWQHAIGGSGNDQPYDMVELEDGLVVSLLLGSAVAEFPGSPGNFIVKYDFDGNLIWQHEVTQTQTSLHRYGEDLILLGVTSESACPDYHGGLDVSLIVMTSAGMITDERCYGGTRIEQYPTFDLTADGGLIISCETISNDGDVSGLHELPGNLGPWDIWTFRLDAQFNIAWQRCYGGTDWDTAPQVLTLVDGGCLVAANSCSGNGDVPGNHTVNNFGPPSCFDIWTFRLSASGDIVWSSYYGGTALDFSRDIIQTEGGFVTLGLTRSEDGDVMANQTSADIWLLKQTFDGDLEWQGLYGGTGLDQGTQLLDLLDGSYLMAGYTTSNDFDVSGNHGNGESETDDIWLARLNTAVGIGERPTNADLAQAFVTPNPSTGIFHFNSSPSVIQLEVATCLGQPVLSCTLDQANRTADLTALPSGTYIARLTCTESTWTCTLIKQ